MEVRPKEGPSHLCSSLSACRETWASEYRVKPSVGDHGRVQATSPQHEAKCAASYIAPPQGANREPSLVQVGEGQGRGEALGKAAPKNPAAESTWNGGTARVETGETRLRPRSEPGQAPPGRWTGSVAPYKPGPGERGVGEAGVGVVHSTAEVADNTTVTEGRDHTWSMCPTEGSAGDCSQS